MTPDVLPYAFQVVVVNYKVKTFPDKFVDPFSTVKVSFKIRKGQ
ncbi:MAG: hypothetical protein ACJAYB_002399, partial [Psychromonas sp.]